MSLLKNFWVPWQKLIAATPETRGQNCRLEVRGQRPEDQPPSGGNPESGAGAPDCCGGGVGGVAGGGVGADCCCAPRGGDCGEAGDGGGVATDVAAAFAASAAFVAKAPMSDATFFPVVAISVATDFPAAATPLNTPTALFRKPIVSAIAVVDTLPALSVSSTPSVKRWKTLGDGAADPAYLDSRNSM